MIYEGEKRGCLNNEELEEDCGKDSDGIPIIDKSPRHKTPLKVPSTSRYFINDEEEEELERISNVSDIFTNPKKFAMIYNQ